MGDSFGRKRGIAKHRFRFFQVISKVPSFEIDRYFGGKHLPKILREEHRIATMRF